MISGAIPTSELESHPWLKIGATLLKPFTAEQLVAVVRNVMSAIDGSSRRGHRKAREDIAI
jgi:hypothetical protein